jgi:hypothetical protein
MITDISPEIFDVNIARMLRKTREELKVVRRNAMG